MKITKNITIEELVEEIPEAVKYLADEGIRCIRCGEPIWGTLEEAAKEKNFSDEDINKFIKDLTKLSATKITEPEQSISQLHIKNISLIDKK